jgi:hypothetical protein
MKWGKTGLWLAIALVVMLLVVVLAYISLDNKGDDDQKTIIQTVDVSLNVGVRVLDLVNNTPVNGIPVYCVFCSPNCSSFRDVHLTNLTEDGWALFFANYTLDKDQVIYLGASDRKPLIESDFAGRAFNGSGYLGAWKAFNYSVLYNSKNNKATVSCTITVDLDSGKMI